ncbi:hypothetical protein G6011_02133 [Alternaria panax]|uniref:Uncharacterized protein n=1 Tax=Alternaria panax TaxID=48097 RepID=A0AAD4FF31_9PLEO|nr:hypothetical protein G6011_02133 [Alternaria panax]
MHSLLQHLKGGNNEPEHPHQTPDPSVKRSRAKARPAPKDPNIPRKRLQVNQKCLYERRLPGKAYISAHVNRLQHGYYRSNALHDAVIDNLFFVSVHFVFHPHNPDSHRFKSAEIEVTVHGDDGDPTTGKKPGKSYPRILKHAPELMFGAVSPENLQWNFSLSSSLGVSQAPVSASLNPKAAVNSSYKVFHMMSIQGSVRSKTSPLGPEHHIEDAKAVWTLTENMLQKSGLPREFDFVLLVQKPEDVENMYMSVDVDAHVGAWYGSYPQWYTNLSKYMPNQDCTLSFDNDIGQRFLPSHPIQGYNFADLMHTLDEYVMMPGTVYPTQGTRQGEVKNPNLIDYHPLDDDKAIEAASTSPKPKQLKTPPNKNKSPRDSRQQHHRSWAHENVNVRVILEHQFPQGSDARRFSYSPLNNLEPEPYPSIRRRKSRAGLKEYGAKQALHELSQDGLEGKGDRSSGGDRLSGYTLR